MALSKKYPIWRIILFFLLNVFDGTSTYWLSFLNGSNDGELNPLVRWLMNEGWGYAAFFKLADVILIIALILYIQKKNKKIAAWALNISIILSVAIVVNNTIMLWRSL